MALFRVYDKANHRWITDDVLIDSGGGATMVEDHKIEAILADHYLPDEVDIEWTTGFEDDHNVQIYEGDIVQVNDEFIGEVRYINFKGGFYVWFEGYNKFKKVKQAEELSYIIKYSDCVVIGNIHGLEREDNHEDY